MILPTASILELKQILPISRATFRTPGILEYTTTYYWKVVVYDIFGDSIIGDTWSFSTKLDYECGDVLYDLRDGKTYSTVEIGNQCWMAENLNIGDRIDSLYSQQDNSLIEKYCYNDLESNCDYYGGLYQWGETMQYSVIESTKGVCPVDWHIPTDLEWKILEGTVDSYYPVGDPVWDSMGWRGIDAGLNLKSTSGWFDDGNGTDLYGFTALPGGRRITTSNFIELGHDGYFWSSTESTATNTWSRLLDISYAEVIRYPLNKNNGMSIRCLKDYSNQPPDQSTNPIPEDGSIIIEIDTTLHWSCSDPEGYDLKYSIYFGTETDPPYIQSNILDTLFAPGILECNSTYYWKVVAYDIFGDSTIGNTWNFSTANQFACGDSLLDTRDSQVYNTVQIGTQCWMAENLNIGIKVDVSIGQIDNSIIEKFCYENIEDSCNVYGGLYQWNEMMSYQTDEITQGICPDGWHLPTDNEWKMLEGTVDSQFGVGDPEWDIWGQRGFDAGHNLKSNYGWFEGGNGIDLYGFRALPAGGYWCPQGPPPNPCDFFLFNVAWFLTSTPASFPDSSNFRSVNYWQDYINRSGFIGMASDLWAASVRCIKD